MPRALFEKSGMAIYMSHLDLMRVFQRAFKRAGLKLTHTQGYSPRPSVSIALPLSVGVESRCELLDFDLDGDPIADADILSKLNLALVDGVRVLDVYQGGDKVKNLAYLDCSLDFEYDTRIPHEAAAQISALFKQDEVVVDKRGKNGTVAQNIAPMIRNLCITETDDNTLRLNARICCQNPSLNPVLITAAVERYLPMLKPDFVRYCRNEIYNYEGNIFR